MINSNIARKFIEKGFSVVPVDDKKLPLGPWKQFQSRFANEKELLQFDSSRCKAIAIVTGRVSGDLELLDIDEKYSLDGELFNNFMKEIPEVMAKKLVIAKTKNGGYHILYRSKNLQGNQKYASRYATDEELASKPGDKVRVLLESRGEAGYFLCQPSPGYKFIQGTLNDVQYILDIEREYIVELSRTFNQVIKEIPAPRETVTYENSYNISPFDDFDQKADVVLMLENQGWTLASQRGNKFYMKRPGTENRWSAEYDYDKNWFTVFSSSTEFEVNKAYKPYAVRAILSGITDWNKLASDLLNEGYGSKKEEKQRIQSSNNNQVDVPSEEDDDDCTVSWDDTMDRVEDFINGLIPEGLDTGYQEFDKHFRFKRGNMVIANGLPNVGKTYFLLWLAMISAARHKWRWILYTAENSNLSVGLTLIAFYCCKPVKETTVAERNEAKAFIRKHFTMIDISEYIDYTKLKSKIIKLHENDPYDAVFIDPYNSLSEESENSHQFNYKVLSDLKIWGRKNDVSIWISMHAVTGASRNIDADGYVAMPNMYATEGGSKNANKSDEFLSIHRIVNHEDPNMRRITMVSIEKVKETLTGGLPTTKGQPIHFEWANGGSIYRNSKGLPVHPFKSIIENIDFEEILN